MSSSNHRPALVGARRGGNGYATVAARDDDGDDDDEAVASAPASFHQAPRPEDGGEESSAAAAASAGDDAPTPTPTDRGEEHLCAPQDEQQREGDDDAESSNSISIDDAIERLGFGRFQYTILTAAGLCFAADGMQVVLLSFLTLVLREEWNLTNGRAEGVTSVLFAGALAGTLVLGPLADRWGRRPVFVAAALVISASGLATAVAPNYPCLLAALGGVGAGVGGLTVPFDLLAEFLPADRRGTHLLLIEYYWTAGCLYVVVLAYFLLRERDPAWRTLVALCALPCGLSLGIGWCCVPESPRWLASRGRPDEALDVLRRAAAVNRRDVGLLFPAELRLREEPEEKRAKIADLFTPRWRCITLRLWGAWFFFAFGYYGTLLATTRVFASTTTSDNDDGDGSNLHVPREQFDYSAIFISSLAEVVGTTMVILVVDRIGRIPSQVISYAVAGVLLCLLCALAGLGATSRRTLILLGFGARAFEMAGTCVTWVSTAEILTTDVRGTGHSTANAIARIGAFLCPFLVEGDAPLVKVGVVMLLVHASTVFCVYKLPETKGREMGFAEEDVAHVEQTEAIERLVLPTDEHDDDREADMGVHSGELS